MKSDKTGLTVFLAFAALSCAARTDNLVYGVPRRAGVQIVDREGYALGYSEKYEQPLWVSYRLTATEPKKMIGFIMPNAPNRNIFKFAVSVDEVERRTGLDFFSALPDDEETRLEASFDTKLWR